MTSIKRLGLGCMGMNMSNKERSIETVRYALDNGITFLNTGEFYGGGESEMVLREALKGVPRDKYFLSVKFGVLPDPKGGIYGLDVNPFNVKAHLTYSLHRLGLDYIDLYEPARMDESVPVEDLIGALEDCVKEGYIKSIGLTQVSSENLERAAKVHPIKMLEAEYSLVNREIEKNGVLDTARKNKIAVLAFGVLFHGLLSASSKKDSMGFAAGLSYEERDKLLSAVKKIAGEKNTTLENLAQAYVYAKNPDMSVLIGTTRKEHLQDSINALSIELSAEDIKRIEEAFPSEKLSGMKMRNIIFRGGKIARIQNHK